MLKVTPEEFAIVKKILKAAIPNHTVWAFGSRVHGRARMSSDLDLAVISETPLPLLTLSNLKQAFSDSDLPFRVDIADWASTDNTFRKIIQEHHQKIQ